MPTCSHSANICGFNEVAQEGDGGACWDVWKLVPEVCENDIHTSFMQADKAPCSTNFCSKSKFMLPLTRRWQLLATSPLTRTITLLRGGITTLSSSTRRTHYCPVSESFLAMTRSVENVSVDVCRSMMTPFVSRKFIPSMTSLEHSGSTIKSPT